MITTSRTATGASSLPTAPTVRVISALLAAAAFFAGAPAWIMAIEAFVIAATVTGLVLLRRPPRPRGA